MAVTLHPPRGNTARNWLQPTTFRAGDEVTIGRWVDPGHTDLSVNASASRDVGALSRDAVTVTVTNDGLTVTNRQGKRNPDQNRGSLHVVFPAGLDPSRPDPDQPYRVAISLHDKREFVLPRATAATFTMQVSNARIPLGSFTWMPGPRRDDIPPSGGIPPTSQPTTPPTVLRKTLLAACAQTLLNEAVHRRTAKAAFDARQPVPVLPDLRVEYDAKDAAAWLPSGTPDLFAKSNTVSGRMETLWTQYLGQPPHRGAARGVALQVVTLAVTERYVTVDDLLTDTDETVEPDTVNGLTRAAAARLDAAQRKAWQAAFDAKVEHYPALGPEFLKRFH